MGNIKPEVDEQHLLQYPDEAEVVEPFLRDFSVTWARRRRAYNTDVSVYFLDPEPATREAYGFTEELMLIYAPYPRFQARSIQAAESFLNDEPARGRVERLTYILVHDCDDVAERIADYLATHPESRVIVSFSARSLRENAKDPWFVRNELNSQLYSRDLFDYRLPLQQDTYFFGRRDIQFSLMDAIRRGENRGLFGLRKTGKTSMLFKLERLMGSEKSTYFLYYDCKSTAIRKLRWFELLHQITRDVCTRASCRQPLPEQDERLIGNSFSAMLTSVPRGGRVVVVFDEIEYISPMSLTDDHWRRDYIDFWQTFWTCQSRSRNLSTIICGVNPSVVETDTVDGIQNPLFGIVPAEYLRGLPMEDMRLMVRTLGKRMGLTFETDAVEYLHDRYGGHPLLIRIACSLTHLRLAQHGDVRPARLSADRLRIDEQERDSELLFYCRHVVSELQQFYPDEYEMLELLATGQAVDYLELSQEAEYTRHLQSYGLLRRSPSGVPEIAIPVVGEYVGKERARRDGRRTLYHVVPTEQRADWLARRRNAILADARFLEKLIQKEGRPGLFGAGSLPEADRFQQISVCTSDNDFESFINICNRCFVESVEAYGKAISKPRYFWEDIKVAYPSLWDALHRIKLYRHHSMHLMLNDQVNADLVTYLQRDLEGRQPSSVPQMHFVLQQCVLDGLLIGLQVEGNSLS